MSKVSSGSLRLSGYAFQTDGLATENARQPNVFRRHRGTIISVEQQIAGTDVQWPPTPTWVHVKFFYHTIELYQPWYVPCRRADISIATGLIRACIMTGWYNLCKCKIIGLTYARLWLVVYAKHYWRAHRCRTRSSSAVTLARPSVSSSLQITLMHHLTCGISSLLRSVNLIVFTVLLVHLILHISPHHSHHLRSHHLPLPRPFTPE